MSVENVEIFLAEDLFIAMRSGIAFSAGKMGCVSVIWNAIDFRLNELSVSVENVEVFLAEGLSTVMRPEIASPAEKMDCVSLIRGAFGLMLNGLPVSVESVGVFTEERVSIAADTDGAVGAGRYVSRSS